ncbi:TIGR03899 family protein [Alteromonas sp. KUL42]|uniref:TIGR03899 family protein n=1 Tax=Alteromonas sp. KUL42 TaxID=2480797 RepID=UPI000B1EBDBA|nr:TIGR03899 family protein [Alteromonas sp. KUL42]TAP33981.1 TIGR03899 family protein [Alteromonas sp. KUL42]GEA08034.1 TIGR03899 family protein [Alteromonas sp. KUL42]
MKITPQHFSQEVRKTQPPQEKSTSQTNDTTPVERSPVNSKVDMSRQRMLSWFARVGISPSMLSPDPKKQKHALERRKQILETQKASNLQAVLNIALNVTINEQTSENLDPDWFFAFSTMSEEIYSRPMQELWGKIFAVEVARPGSFSLRTLQLLKTLTHRDAKIFAKAVSIASKRNNDPVPRILVGYHKRKGLLSFLKKPVPEQLNLSTVGLSYPDLLSLQEMKLIYASEIESGEYNEGQKASLRCVNDSINLTCRAPGVALVYYKFTPVGSELYTLVGKTPNESYITAIRSILAEVFDVT